MTSSRIRSAAAIVAATVAVTSALGAAATSTAAPAQARPLGASAEVTSTAATEAALAQAAPVRLRIVQHNTDQQKKRWNRVVQLVESGDWDAATVQEVCEEWKGELKKARPGWSIAYHEQTSNSSCPGGGKGNVVIRPGKGRLFAQAFNVAGEGKTFGIACVSFTKAGRKVHACSTHFSVYDTNPKEVRLRQAKRVKEITGVWLRKGHSVVLAGDLNTTPSAAALNPIYQFPTGRSNGRFVEAAQLDAGTKRRVGPDTVAGRKIDYVFFSTNHTPLSAGGTLTQQEVVQGAHQILKASTTLR